MTSGSVKEPRISPLPTRNNKSARRKPTVVLSDSTSGRNVILDLVERADPSPVQVHDCATRLNQVTLSVGTRGQTLTQKLFVLADEVLELTFLGGERVELVDIELAELFDVDRSAVLRGSRGSRNVSAVQISLWRPCSRPLGSPCRYGGSTGGSTCQPLAAQGIQSFCAERWSKRACQYTNQRFRTFQLTTTASTK
jgi:hypothetical protein